MSRLPNLTPLPGDRLTVQSTESKVHSHTFFCLGVMSTLWFGGMKTYAQINLKAHFWIWFNELYAITHVRCDVILAQRKIVVCWDVLLGGTHILRQTGICFSNGSLFYKKSLKGHWTSVTSFPTFSKKKLRFYTIRSVGMGNDCLLSFTF